jgi:antitoxin HicB
MIEYPAKIVYDKVDKNYNVEFPDLPGCFTYGSTIEEAMNYAKEALTGYLESIDLRKIDIPKPSKLKGKNIYYIQPEKKIAFAIWLKSKRIENGLTQKQMADKLNIAFQSYQRFENPHKTNPTLSTIAKLENVFNDFVLNI